jgi:hypothetical protein
LGTHPQNAIACIFNRLTGLCQEVWNQKVQFMRIINICNVEFSD